MLFQKLEIKEFRCFIDKTVHLGKYVTVLAGRNSTGKSTILGMLANSTEMKSRIGRTYFHKQFRADFSEILKGSQQYDPIGSDKFNISIVDEENEVVEKRHFRVAWQAPRKVSDKDSDNQRIKTDKKSLRTRFRVIPTYKDSDGKTRETKFDLPVYYLGLSRLFPIGEAKDDSISHAQMAFVSDEHKNWFIETYNKILYLNEDIQDVSRIAIGETDKKRAVGVTTASYDYFTNSAGQDNLGQILMALLSFRQIKSSVSPWRGGLLLIDEFDATLHPAAQNELFDVLCREAKQIGFQVVFTTHSISLLKHISSKIGHNKADENNNIELYYFTKKNRILEVNRNSDIAEVEGDLMVKSMGRRISVYAEDDEARWFFEKLVSSYMNFVSMPDISLGCTDLLRLLSGDVQYFGNVIILFDGDVSDNEIEGHSIAKRTKNIIKLPGNVRPEQVIYEYILSLSHDHPFWDDCKVMQYSWDYFKHNGPNSGNYQGNERDKYKAWFNEHKANFDALNLYSFWAADNKDDVEYFISSFKSAYNTIAMRLSIPQIS